MSRTLTKNTSNFISWSSNLLSNGIFNGASKIAISMHINITSLTGNKYRDVLFNNYINASALAGVWISLHNGTSNVIVVGGRSQSSDSFQEKVSSATISTGTWQHVGAMFDFGGDVITPYVNGSASNGGSVTFGASTYTQSTSAFNDRISGLPTGAISTDCIDGLIGEMAIWKLSSTDTLQSGEWSALGAKVSPLRIRPDVLAGYWRFNGYINTILSNREIDVLGLRNADLNGTVALADGVPVFRNSYPKFPSVAAGGGGGFSPFWANNSNVVLVGGRLAA